MSEDAAALNAAALLELKADLKKIEDRIQINEILVRAMARSNNSVKRAEYLVGYFLNEDIRNATMNIITDSLVVTLEQLREV